MLFFARLNSGNSFLPVAPEESIEPDQVVIEVSSMEERPPKDRRYVWKAGYPLGFRPSVTVGFVPYEEFRFTDIHGNAVDVYFGPPVSTGFYYKTYKTDGFPELVDWNEMISVPPNPVDEFYWGKENYEEDNPITMDSVLWKEIYAESLSERKYSDPYIKIQLKLLQNRMENYRISYIQQAAGGDAVR